MESREELRAMLISQMSACLEDLKSSRDELLKLRCLTNDPKELEVFRELIKLKNKQISDTLDFIEKITL